MTLTVELHPYSWFTMRQAFKHCDELLGWEDGKDSETRDMAWEAVTFFGGGTALSVINEDRLDRYVSHLRENSGDDSDTINWKLLAVSTLMHYATLAGKLAGGITNFPWQEERQ